MKAAVTNLSTSAWNNDRVKDYYELSKDGPQTDNIAQHLGNLSKDIVLLMFISFGINKWKSLYESLRILTVRRCERFNNNF